MTSSNSVTFDDGRTWTRTVDREDWSRDRLEAELDWTLEALHLIALREAQEVLDAKSRAPHVGDDADMLLGLVSEAEGEIEEHRARCVLLEDALRAVHRAVGEYDGSDCDDARLEDALRAARELAPYTPEPPDPKGI